MFLFLWFECSSFTKVLVSTDDLLLRSCTTTALLRCLLETPAARSVLHSLLILHVLLISFDISFAVRGSLHFDDHARSCSPGSTFTYYYAVLGSVYYAATMVLRCTRVLEVVKRHDSDVSFPFSVNFCRTVSQVGSKVTLLMEDLQGLRR